MHETPVQAYFVDVVDESALQPLYLSDTPLRILGKVDEEERGMRRGPPKVAQE